MKDIKHDLLMEIVGDRALESVEEKIRVLKGQKMLETKQGYRKISSEEEKSHEKCLI